jgi:glycosyltransferase involved in cell wall biosynthesis
LKYPLKIKHFCTYPNRGGAGVAAWRLVKGLRRHGLDADLFGIWQDREKSDSGARTVRFDKNPIHIVWRLVRKLQVERQQKKINQFNRSKTIPFSIDYSPLGQPMMESANKATIVHLHWVCDFIDYEYFFSNLPVGIPIFWTLHDMNPFMGGFHYEGDQSRNIQLHLIDKYYFNVKKNAYRNLRNNQLDVRIDAIITDKFSDISCLKNKIKASKSFLLKKSLTITISLLNGWVILIIQSYHLMV